MGSASKLQQQIRDWFNANLPCQYRENARPEWLITPAGERCELDFYASKQHLAVEVQGRQHYEYVPHFHKSYEGFLSQQKRDNFKVQICRIEKVELFIVHDVADLDRVNSYLLWQERVPLQLDRSTLEKLKGSHFYNRWLRRVDAVERYKQALLEATEPAESRKYNLWIQAGEVKIVDLLKANFPLISRTMREVAIDARR